MAYARRVSTSPEREPLPGKVAIVTGGSSGIGQAVARELAGLGAKVLITARREERLAELAEQIGCVSVAGDVVDPALPDLARSHSPVDGAARRARHLSARQTTATDAEPRHR
jgi:NADP-dependent 3-hydroxy acid dehydrogenase YdfG